MRSPATVLAVAVTARSARDSSAGLERDRGPPGSGMFAELDSAPRVHEVCIASSALMESTRAVPAGDPMRPRAFAFVRACLVALAAASFVSACSAGSSSAHSASGSSSGAASSPQAALPPGTQWAAWINRDIQFDLQDLPHAYTCDELWYKLHAILLSIGAREYMSIERYDCGKGTSGGRMPTVHLRFFTLRPVTGDQIRWANTRAMEKTIVLAPGEPKRLDPGDCALVKQVQGTVLAYLNVPVVSSHFECSKPSPHDFELSVRVLERWPPKSAAQ